MTWLKIDRKKSFKFYSHCSLRDGHVKVVEDLIRLRFWSVVFEGMPHRHCILLSTPLRPAIVYCGYRRVASPVSRRNKMKRLKNLSDEKLKIHHCYS